jgi:hypothetical protein
MDTTETMRKRTSSAIENVDRGYPFAESVGGPRRDMGLRVMDV